MAGKKKSLPGTLDRFLKVVSGLAEEVAEDFRRGAESARNPKISREQAIGFVGGFAGAVKGPGSLRLAFKAGTVEKGGKALRFDITQDGKSVTKLEMFVNNAEDKIFIEGIGDIVGLSTKNKLGLRNVGGLLNQIKAMFPKLKEFAGERISGMRTNVGTSKAARTAAEVPDISGGMLPGERIVGPLARVRVGKAQGKASLSPSLDFARQQRVVIDRILAKQIPRLRDLQSPIPGSTSFERADISAVGRFASSIMSIPGRSAQ